MRLFKEYLFLMIVLLSPVILFIEFDNKIMKMIPNYKDFYVDLISGSYFHIVISVFYIAVVLFFTYRIYRHYKPRWRVKKAAQVLFKIRGFNSSGSHIGMINYLKKIDPFVFEELLLTCFKEAGFKIKRNRRYTGDGGIDGKVWINGRQNLIQAKRYKSYIKKSHVQEFIDLCDKRKKDGLFIHTGKIGRESILLINNSKRVKNMHDKDLINFIITPSNYNSIHKIS